MSKIGRSRQWSKDSSKIHIVEKDDPRIITPDPKWTYFPGPDTFNELINGLRTNNGQICAGIRSIVGIFNRVEAVTPVYLATGEPFGMEIKVEFWKFNTLDRKEYFFLYTANIEKDENFRNNGPSKVCCKSGRLMDEGQFIPTNAQELVSVVNAFGGGVNEHQPVILWFEGEKARVGGRDKNGVLREGGDQRVKRCADQFKSRHWNVVTASTLSGLTGSRRTNYSLVPNERVVAEGAKIGVVYTKLELEKAIHILVMDNDKRGMDEAFEIGARLIEDYGVEAAQVRLCRPSAGFKYNDGSDDADALPEGVTDVSRCSQMIHAKGMVDIAEYTRWKDRREAVASARARGLRAYSKKVIHYDRVNVAIALERHELLCDAFSYDLFRRRPMETKALPDMNGVFEDGGIFPRPLTDMTVSKVHYILQEIDFPGIAIERISEGILSHAYTCSYHPIKDYLEELSWDGQERIPTALHKYWGTTNDAYHTAVGRIFFLSGVARIYEPGCKVDTMIILEGAQGNRKSSSCEALAGKREFYSNSLPDLQYQYKDAILHTRGKWIIEISELSSFTKAEVEKIKSFLSAGESDVRPPYGHFEENVKYQCIFIGPTNSGSYLKDATGNRRFIPAKTGTIDLEGLVEHRDQLWAEAVAKYKRGDKWWPSGDEDRLFGVKQEAAYVQPSYTDEIEVFMRMVRDEMNNGGKSGRHFEKGFVIGDVRRSLQDQVRGLVPNDKSLTDTVLHLGGRAVVKEDGSPVRIGRGRLWVPPEVFPEVDEMAVVDPDVFK